MNFKPFSNYFRAFKDFSKIIQFLSQEKAKNSVPKDPVGVLGNGPIAFGAGAVLTKEWIKEVKEVDSIQFVETN